MPEIARRLAFINGNVQTFDDADRSASQILVDHDRIAAVGGGLEIGPADEVIDLEGRTVIPGLIEGHVHVVSLGVRPGYHTPIETARSISEVQEILAQRRPDVPEGEFITSLGGWHVNHFRERRLPALKELDEAVPDRPVLLFQYADGPCATNSLGKAFFGSATPPVDVADDGSISAGLESTTALFYLRSRQTFEDRLRSTQDAMAYAASVGLTAMLDQTLVPSPGPFKPTQKLPEFDHFRLYDAWLELHRQRKTTVRLQVNFLHNQNDVDLPELKERLRNQFPFFGDDLLRTGGIGEWAAPGAGEGEAWFESQRVVAAAGWRNENAVRTLEAFDKVVAGYEKVHSEFDISSLRWVVHHVPFANDGILDRLKAIGGAVQMRSYWPTATAANNGAPFRLILDHGIQAGIHGDGAHVAPLSPWPHISYATTGFNALGEDVNGGQKVTRKEALRLFTRGNSWFLRMEDKLGSIEAGKLADIVVLNKNYLTVPDDELSRIKPVMTVVGGNIVYDSRT